MIVLDEQGIHIDDILIPVESLAVLADYKDAAVDFAIEMQHPADTGLSVYRVEISTEG